METKKETIEASIVFEEAEDTDDQMYQQEHFLNKLVKEQKVWLNHVWP